MIDENNVTFNEKYNCNFCNDGRAYETVENYARINFPSYTSKNDSQIQTILVIGAYNGQEIDFYLQKYRNAIKISFW